MGRRYEEVLDEITKVPYAVEKDNTGMAVVRVDDKAFTPPEISARVLQKMRQTAEDYLGQKVTQAVITVPAYFNDSQRQATKDAGRIAGLEVLRIINEPTAAALAYGLDKKKDEKIAVFDFGGGTFDISILELGEGVFEVKSTNGDTHLGGDDLDHVIIDWLAEEFRKDQGIDLRKDPMALQRLKDAAEKAKCELSTVSETSIEIPFITADQSGPKHLNIKISRSKLEQLIDPFVERVVRPCKQAMSDAGLSASQIDEVILVCGSTRIPLIQKKVKELFQKEPNKSVNPDEAVAIGAAIQAGVLGKEIKDVLLLDVTPLSLGIETLGDVFSKLIERNTTIPTQKKQVYSTATDNQPAVTIKVYQGEREIASKNRLLGEFNLEGLPPAPRGLPQIEVSFDIDANGILNVSAKDLGTGKQKEIIIKSGSGLSDADIKAMVKDAEEHADQDKKKREETTVKNEADALVYSIEKMLAEHGDKLDPADKTRVEEACADLRKAIEGGDVDAIKKKMDALNTASHKISEALYSKAARQQAGPETRTSTAGAQAKTDAANEDVMDAEFEVEDEKK
jgi:molecular chaperone DnaK